MIIALSNKGRQILARAWRGAVSPLEYFRGSFSFSQRKVSSDEAPTSDEIRGLLENNPRLAFEAYLRYREAGGAPHRFRPSEIRQLLTAGAATPESVEELALR